MVYYNFDKKAIYFDIEDCANDFMCPSLCVECPIAKERYKNVRPSCKQFIMENPEKVLPLMHTMEFNSMAGLRDYFCCRNCAHFREDAHICNRDKHFAESIFLCQDFEPRW